MNSLEFEKQKFSFRWSDFDSLDNADLYDMLKLRVDVFVVEQKCAYPEIDGKDKQAIHLLMLEGKEVAGVLRLLHPVGDGAVKLGRVVVHSKYRAQGVGKILFSKGIEKCRELYPEKSILVSAQVQLQKFYSGFGFAAISSPYLDDGIEHVDMELSAAD